MGRVASKITVRTYRIFEQIKKQGPFLKSCKREISHKLLILGGKTPSGHQIEIIIINIQIYTVCHVRGTPKKWCLVQCATCTIIHGSPGP